MSILKFQNAPLSGILKKKPQEKKKKKKKNNVKGVNRFMTLEMKLITKQKRSVHFFTI